jgi:hypothetical protein
MERKSISIIHALGVLVFVISAFMLCIPLSAKSAAEPSSDGKSGIDLLCFVDPDGREHMWALPAESAVGISRRLAAKYPSKSIDGVTFYSVHSWRETANLVIEAHTQQRILIVDLLKKIKRQKAKATDRQLIRHQKTKAPKKSLADRVSELEKKLNAMTDAGYR